jgi:radical SAM protein with 4Fe4S-binding SPASM domain
MSLMLEMGARALKLGVPLSVQMDVTYRCNERCVHCYLDHDDHGEMSTAEIKGVLDQLAEAGVFFLIFSGGEVFMRMDFFEVVEYARALMFSVKVKTNAFMIGEKEADRLAAHILANVLMRPNFQDYAGVKALAKELGAEFTIDPTITPMMDGDRSILSLGIEQEELQQVFRDEGLVGNVDEFCAPPAGPMAEADALEMLPCTAGHTACYISPYGDVYPCVQFPMPSGNVRRSKFLDIWRHSPELNEVRSITIGDLQGCSQCVHGSSCTRCPGLAYMEGNMRGPSIQDCEKSFARTGVPSVNLQKKKSVTDLVQIQLATVS